MIDWGRVDTLRGELGAVDFAIVSEMFLDEIEGVLMHLRHGDGDQMAKQLYFLIGCAANLGFVGFGNLCRAAETALRAGRAGSADIPALMQAYAVTKKEFGAGIVGQGGCAPPPGVRSGTGPEARLG